MNNSNEKFGRIYDEYIDKIYRFVYLKVNSQEIAEDITSKVFTSGWESYKNNQTIGNIGAFLYKIARNNVIDYYREKGKMKLISPDSLQKVIDTKVNLHEEAVLNADIELVKSAIFNIENKDHQDVLIWHYLDDMPISEISEILNKPEGTVRVMLHRGLNSLKNELREQA